MDHIPTTSNDHDSSTNSHNSTHYEPFPRSTTIDSSQLPSNATQQARDQQSSNSKSKHKQYSTLDWGKKGRPRNTSNPALHAAQIASHHDLEGGEGSGGVTPSNNHSGWGSGSGSGASAFSGLEGRS